MSQPTKERGSIEPAAIVAEITAFVRTSPLNGMPEAKEYPIFDDPLVQFADGDDPIFTQYKTIIAPTHLTPREALAKAYRKNPADMPEHISVISWILPITEKTRKANRSQTEAPARVWSYTRWYGEKFHDTLRQHMVEFLVNRGYLAVAPFQQPFFATTSNEKGPYSNWSERHVAYAAGLGTFSLSDGFITERGIAHRCGSIVTDLVLPASPRTAEGPYSNCLLYVNASCKACIARCPAGAISEKGHDKLKCNAYLRQNLKYLLEELKVGNAGCGLCQTKVPCEAINPTRKLKRKARG
ncbi:MAG: epoxyqueuosine reductase [Chloroflexota bacterium]